MDNTPAAGAPAPIQVLTLEQAKEVTDGDLRFREDAPELLACRTIELLYAALAEVLVSVELEGADGVRFFEARSAGLELMARVCGEV